MRKVKRIVDFDKFEVSPFGGLKHLKAILEHDLPDLIQKETMTPEEYMRIAVDYQFTDKELAESKRTITRLKTHIFTRIGFFARLLAELEMRPCGPGDPPELTTMATDGLAIAYNPIFVNELTDSEVLFIIIHEIMHCAMAHFERAESAGAGGKMWNMAADYAINPLITHGKMPGGKHAGLIDDKYKGWSSEKIYSDLLQQAKEEAEKNGQGPNELKNGDYISLGNGQYGRITNITPNGDIDYDPVSKQELQDLYNKMKQQ